MKKEYWIITDNPKIKTSEYLDEFRQIIGKNKIYCSFTDTEIDELCPSPEELEIIKFKANIEPDKEHLNKSYNDFSKETDKKFMTARQGIILALNVYKITGESLDVDGLTRFHSLAAHGNAMSMCRNHDGEFSISRSDRDNRDSSHGPRQQYSLLTSSFEVGQEIKVEIDDKLYKVKIVE